MSVFRQSSRRPPPQTLSVLRHLCTSPAATTSHSKEPPSSHRHHHDFLPPSSYINSWKPTRDPRDAEERLAFLRRDYDRKVREIRKIYIQEMELQRIEKLRKDEARKEALRIANEERKAAKDAKKKAEAIERQAAEEEFRQMLEMRLDITYGDQVEKFLEHLKECDNMSCRKDHLSETLLQMKERAAKLEHWRKREMQVEEKKKEKKELIRRQSSLWIDESKIESKALEASAVATPL